MKDKVATAFRECEELQEAIKTEGCPQQFDRGYLLGAIAGFEHGYKAGEEAGQEWVSVEDRLPTSVGDYPVLCREGVMVSFFTHDKKFALNTLYKIKVTHWLPLPESPGRL